MSSLVPYERRFLSYFIRLYVEQPVGVGFTQGTGNIVDEVGLAEQFLGFYRIFVNTFEVQNRKTYLTGESYAGFYIPYIANAFLDQNETSTFNLGGIMLGDPIIGDGALQKEGTFKPHQVSV